MAGTDERYAFIAEWYDANAALIRRYQFLYYNKDATIEMFDIKNRRLFLKRSKFENLSLKDLYLGSIINVHARQLKITDYADQYTRNKLENATSKTYAMIKPDAIKRAGEIIEKIERNDFVICQAKMIQLTRSPFSGKLLVDCLCATKNGKTHNVILEKQFVSQQTKDRDSPGPDAAKFYAEHEGKPFFEKLMDFVTSGPVLSLELMGVNSVKKWRHLLGPTNTQKAKDEAPESLRALFGTDATRNACHGADSDESAEREIDFFFGPKSPEVNASLENCTLCIIKPHAVASGMSGQIMTAITEAGFTINALQMFRLEKADAEEFYEIYKGVVNEYSAMVEELCNGACIVMEIVQDENVPTTFREFVGPADPEIARHIRKNTLRAKFGIDKIKNAVHCTDLPDDAKLEVEYFFRILN